MKKDAFIRLNFRQMVALVDLETEYAGKDSPARDKRTRNALERRLMWSERGEQVLPRGRAYLQAAEFDVGWWLRNVRERRRPRLRAVS